MFIFIMIICLLIVVVTMVKTQHFFRCAFLSVMQGIFALFAVNFVGEFIGVHLPVNWFSLGIGAVGGLPGVIYLLICDIMCAI